jgi:hypothetical protein
MTLRLDPQAEARVAKTEWAFEPQIILRPQNLKEFSLLNFEMRLSIAIILSPSHHCSLEGDDIFSGFTGPQERKVL